MENTAGIICPNTPKVSFLIPAYNYEHYLARCVESVLAQHDASWDLLLVDDCSTDNTWPLCQHYAQQDSRISAIQLAKNQGQYQIINEYSRTLAGEYGCVLDADDYLAPDYVGQMYAYGKQHDFDIVMCLHYNIAGERRLFCYNYGLGIGRQGLRGYLLAGLLRQEYFIIDCGTLVKTGLRRQIYSHLPKLPMYAATDDMQALFLALHSRNIAVLKRPLYFHNKSSRGTWGNNSREFRLKKVSSMLACLHTIYYLANQLYGNALSPNIPYNIPMAKNIQAAIAQSLRYLQAPQQRQEFYRELQCFFEGQTLLFPLGQLDSQPSQGWQQVVLELETIYCHYHNPTLEQQPSQARPLQTNKAADGYSWLDIYKMRCKQQLRYVKHFVRHKVLARYFYKNQ